MADTAEFDTSRLRELAKAATPGPWTDMPHGEKDGLVTYGSPPRSLTAGGRYHDPEFLGAGKFLEQADATFVAALNPAVVLSLLDRIEELDRQLEADGKNCATYHVDESIYDADLAAANRRIEECEALLRSMEPTIAAAMAATWTPEQIQAYRKALKKP